MTLGLQDDGAGDGDALALAAGEFVRIAVVAGRIDADLAEGGGGAVGALGGRQRRLVHEQPFGDDLADGHARRQRAVGVLKDDLELAAQRLQLAPGEAGDVLPEEAYAPAGRQQAEQRAPERRFAGAEFADDAHGLRLAQAERDVVDGTQLDCLAGEDAAAAADGEGDADVLRPRAGSAPRPAAAPCCRAARPPPASACRGAWARRSPAPVAPLSTISPARMT